MKAITTFLISTLMLSAALASSELVTPTWTKKKPVPPASQAPVELGGCKAQEPASGGTEEDFARKEAEKNDLSKQEILARLIYSESLSTGYWNGLCQASSDSDIMESIGWGILTRVQGKKKSALDPYAETVFAKSQFRTSFSGKKVNPFAEAFLCPLKADTYLSNAKVKAKAAELFRNAQVISQRLINTYETSGIPEKNKGVTNFFYPRSEFFGEMRPKWAKDPDAQKNKGYLNVLGVPANPCVEFYKL